MDSPENIERPAEEESEEPKPEKTEAKNPSLFRQLFSIFGLIFGSFRDLILKFMNIQDSTDIRKTVKNIHDGIELQGYNIWILIASTVLACIGLDQDSGAVIIGAMLISPLMSPILGVGLSIGMNDRDVLLRSSYNFGIMVGISLLTSAIYFFISPLANETPQILSRIKPTLLDVMVGFFGGVAGIVAGSRKEVTNAIPGVAIATALMPPLCVAGFGLATFRIDYFAGAFYLFFLNVVFISLSTFLVVRFLNFPLKAKITLNLLKNFKIGVVLFVLVLLVPAAWLFIDVIADQRQEGRIQAFLDDKFPQTEFSIGSHKVLDQDSMKFLMISVSGTQYLHEDTISAWEKQLKPRYRLKEMNLRIFQSGSDPNDSEQLRRETQAEINRRFDEYQRDRDRWLQDRDEISRLTTELESVKAGKLPISEIRDEIQAYVPELAGLDLGEMRTANLRDTTTRKHPENDELTFWLVCTWQDTLLPGVMKDRKKLLKDRLKDRYNIRNLTIVDGNTPMINYDQGED